LNIDFWRRDVLLLKTGLVFLKSAPEVFCFAFRSDGGL
jgi:hypothetical protein